MAVNPMQRRARNSFLIGFLVALIIMALVVLLLLYRIKSLNEAKEALESKQSEVYVAATDLKSGDEVTMASFKRETVQTTMDQTQIISSTDFEFIDEETGELIEKYAEDGTKTEKKLIMKVSVPANSIVTKDMVSEEEDQTTNDQRIQEFNMIILPSELRNGDYIDIRVRFPRGEDYIVVAKKKVIKCNTDTIWIKLSEEEILSLGNAIVEAYTAEGTKLYATTYSEPGLQDAAIPTYAVSEEVLSLINSNPNISTEAREGLWQRYNEQGQSEQRVSHINSALSPFEEDRSASVETGIEQEITSLQTSRESFVEALDGTGEVGDTTY